ncbi:PQQ-dependent sugar dehydrogenase [Mucilaginibacter arboris]|uniref:Sorbosone dehydrogenase family protein n=1 Tax=Mucilaginibacter arboris TaxID=2682090 RepID=A0A7K1SXT6_9SPHI|nr:sorbosone dehydrogenase family protein [Mucilaginibacter arboris]MVN22141.1 sorbosone dehydrogenase family protein [Mucilaginibacter arboris]
MKNKLLTIAALAVAFAGCQSQEKKKEENKDKADVIATTDSQQVNLPAPYATKSVKKFSKIIGWPNGKKPVAPAGFTVQMYATNLKSPRNIYIGPNGDIFISEANTEAKGVKKVANEVSGKSQSGYDGPSANRITILRDANHDGKPELQKIFLSGLKEPYGMLVLNNYFYVANTDGIWRYPYKTGQTAITEKGQKILDLPAGGYNNHWTRKIIASTDGSKIYVSVGSGSNDGEHGKDNEKRRADILQINPDGSGEKIYASGLRNPAGIAFAPDHKTLWAAVNERDELGDNLVPDYLTSVKEGGFYGWPYAYFGQHEDPNHKGENPEMVKKTITPDVALGPHTASLGLTFYTKNAFPAKYHNGAFVGQHGSWNRSVFSGYKVVFVPFDNGKPGKIEDFLTGFIADESKNEVYGRPVAVEEMPDGSLLVADDGASKIWRVSASK